MFFSAARRTMIKGNNIVRVHSEDTRGRSSASKQPMLVASSLPSWLRLLLKWGLQLVILTAVAAAVVVPVVLVVRANTRAMPLDRLTCPKGKCKQTVCKCVLRGMVCWCRNVECVLEGTDGRHSCYCHHATKCFHLTVSPHAWIPALSAPVWYPPA